MTDRALCDKPQVKPSLAIDSSASSTADLHDTVNDENSENVLLCTKGPTVQGNEAKDQEDGKIRSRAPNKRRKRSNMEKSLDVFCGRFTQISKEETERYLKAKEDWHKQEMDFQLKQAQLENERQCLEREHEMNLGHTMDRIVEMNGIIHTNDIDTPKRLAIVRYFAVEDK
ncbi:hypothetical protein P5673_011806 [Acropora cervicornis]|uniref:No apical meristem-associated C-terminal domain-containing protein n=1 Tax=Acropora cervicornis TaxID=6130 RepID=A0AAD9V882_ACRCE|nr:hypothetical protein P5673_011806 [Acropora cervicornis]